MNAHTPAPSILESAGVDARRAGDILSDALKGADDGELFVERSESESFLFDDGRLKSAAYDATEGFGLRVVAGETAGYAHASEISEAAIARAAASARLAKRGYSGVAAESPRATNTRLYGDDNPLASPAFSDKVALLQEIDAWCRARDPRVVQVMAALAGEQRTVEILRADGKLIRDIRPLARINIQLTVDDEGTPTERTVLIEDGILVGYMHDRMSARLMGLAATGNGRRQSYAHLPMPRMTNTGMMAGDTPREEMIAATKRGLYCANFGGGQVDITNGKFVFQCTEAYLIEDGKVTVPVKGATLIGDGPSALTRVTMIGDDFAFDDGVGVCGKSGQSVPVGVGQPSLKITGLTVGGTSV